jgi:hypothetical protein
MADSSPQFATLEAGHPSVPKIAHEAGVRKVIHEGASSTSGNAKDWSGSRFSQIAVSPGSMVTSAPLGIKLKHLVRNKHLNPYDQLLTERQLLQLQTLLDNHQEVIHELKQKQGATRHDEMLRRLRAGALKSVDELAHKLTPDELEVVADRVARNVANGSDPNVSKRFELKNALMRKLLGDAALTTPSGEVFIAGNGDLSKVMSSYDEFEDYVSSEFFGELVLFFVGCGCLDDMSTQALLSKFFERRNK